jgi:hypothetical protein
MVSNLRGSFSQTRTWGKRSRGQHRGARRDREIGWNEDLRSIGTRESSRQERIDQIYLSNRNERYYGLLMFCCEAANIGSLRTNPTIRGFLLDFFPEVERRSRLLNDLGTTRVNESLVLI